MTIGVLIPTFNRKSYLAKALQSVLDQSYQKLEILVIDNGSTDDTAEFMSGISDPRVRYVVNETNIGMIGSINKGVKLFSENVAWSMILSDDDALARSCLEELVKTASNTGATSVVHAHRVFIDEQGNRIREARLSPREETALDYFDLRSRGRRESYLTGVLFSRAAFYKIGGYPPFSTGLGSDDAFIFALSLQDRLIFEQAAIALVRIHQDAESRSGTEGVKKLVTLKEFSAYCLRTADKFGNFTPEQHRSFIRSLKRYEINLNSYWWRTAVHAALAQGTAEARDELKLLRSFVRNDRQIFSLRIRLNICIEKMTHVNPESCRVYRTWGKLVDYALFLLRNRLP